MLFNSFIFLIFLALVIPVYFALPRHWRKYFLIVASYVFYGYWDWRFCTLILLSTLVDFFAARMIYRKNSTKEKKLFLLLSIVVNLGILASFKYFQFFIDSFAPLAAIFGGNLDYLHLNIILPIGISFYTFQTMAYTIDVYRGKLKPTNNFIDFALYVSFFPQLVAGPIERAGHLLPQIENINKPTREQVNTGIMLIVIGMFKKIMIGDTAGRIVDNIFTYPGAYRSDELVAAMILFSIQIYADFSGYSSIARGTARLFGVELMRNFEQPYFSTNVAEFWKRWHISLSSWLRDYLYIPLGGNRKGEFRTYINIMITMLLGGLWHGANWTFVIWGGINGLYLWVYKFFNKNKPLPERYSYKGVKSLIFFVLKIGLVFALITLARVFFRAPTIDEAFFIIGKFISWETGEFLWRFIRITAIFVFITYLIDFFEYYTGRHSFLTKIRSLPVRYAVMTALVFVTLLYMFQSEPNPFIYFQF